MIDTILKSRDLSRNQINVTCCHFIPVRIVMQPKGNAQLTRLIMKHKITLLANRKIKFKNRFLAKETNGEDFLSSPNHTANHAYPLGTYMTPKSLCENDVLPVSSLSVAERTLFPH